MTDGRDDLEPLVERGRACLRAALPFLACVVLGSACAHGRQVVKLRSEPPPESTALHIAAVMEEATLPQSDVRVASFDDGRYIIVTGWYIVGGDARDQRVAKVIVSIEGHDVKITRELRVCARSSLSCELDRPVYGSMPVWSSGEPIPVAHLPEMFDAKLLAARLERELGGRGP